MGSEEWRVKSEEREEGRRRPPQRPSPHPRRELCLQNLGRGRVASVPANRSLAPRVGFIKLGDEWHS